MNHSSKLHRAWLVLVAAMLIYAGSTGINMNCTGVLFSAILEDKGFRAGDLSLFYTIRSLSSAFVMPITTKLFFEKNTKMVLGILGTMTCVGIGAMCLFNDLWQWYIAGVLVGVGSSCFMVTIPVVLNNWFHKRNGFAIGLTMSASGVAGAIFSPILAGIIGSIGWRQAAVVMALVSFCLIVPSGVFLLVASPDKVGWQPYGAGEENGADGKPRSLGPKTQPQGYIFALCLLAAIATGGIMQFSNQLPTFAKTVGYAGTVGAILTSCCMVGNLVGKLIYGMLNDRVGIYHAARIYLVVVCGSMGGFLFLHGSIIALYGAATLFGAIYAVSTMSPSLLFLNLYGEEQYKAKLSRMQATNSIISSFLSAAIPYMYDATGSFNIVFVYGTVTSAIAFVIYTYLCGYAQKSKAQA